jgi:hypothetical protein
MVHQKKKKKKKKRKEKEGNKNAYCISPKGIFQHLAEKRHVLTVVSSSF